MNDKPFTKYPDTRPLSDQDALTQNAKLARNYLAHCIVKPNEPLASLIYGDIENELMDSLVSGLTELKHIQSGYVYLAQSTAWPDCIKIGYTRFNPKKRVQQLNGPGNLDTLKLVGQVASIDPYLLEQFLHQAFSQYRVKGEFFRVQPKSILEQAQQLSAKIEKACHHVLG